MRPLFLLIWIVVHAPGGQVVIINPHQVTTLRGKAKGGEDHLLVEGANCMISIADGKFVSVIESCAAVRQMIDETKRTDR